MIKEFTKEAKTSAITRRRVDSAKYPADYQILCARALLENENALTLIQAKGEYRRFDNVLFGALRELDEQNRTPDINERKITKDTGTYLSVINNVRDIISNAPEFALSEMLHHEVIAIHDDVNGDKTCLNAIAQLKLEMDAIVNDEVKSMIHSFEGDLAPVFFEDSDDLDDFAKKLFTLTNLPQDQNKNHRSQACAIKAVKKIIIAKGLNAPKSEQEAKSLNMLLLTLDIIQGKIPKDIQIEQELISG